MTQSASSIGESRSGHRQRVWIINQYAFAPDQPAGTRHFELARELVRRGHDVTIFAAGFSHVTGREERLPSRGLYRVQRFDGVRFVWLRTPPYRGNTWRRGVNMLAFPVVYLVVQSRCRAPDTIVGSTVQPFAAFSAWVASRLRDARFIFEIRDLWPQTLVDLGALRRGSPAERLLRTIEAFLVRRASAVITLLPGMRDYLIEHGLPYEHVVYIPNGVDVTTFGPAGASGAGGSQPTAHALAAIERLRADGRFVVGYVGVFGRVNRVDVIVEAARIAERLAPGRVGVVLIGDGPERPAVERLVATEPAVVVAAAVPRRSVPAVLRALDATVVHATATPVYRYGISFNKLFEYMAAERPVVFACESAYDPVRASGAGLTVQPDHPDELAAAFVELAAIPRERLAAMGAAGRDYVVTAHNRERLGASFAALIEERATRS